MDPLTANNADDRVAVKPMRTWTAQEVRALGVRTDVPTAGAIIAGLCRDESYRMVQRGEFPVPVVRVGKNRLVVPVGPILRLLRIGSPDEGDAGSLDVPAGAERTSVAQIARAEISE